jgi:hypothetical protein
MFNGTDAEFDDYGHNFTSTDYNDGDENYYDESEYPVGSPHQQIVAASLSPRLNIHKEF